MDDPSVARVLECAASMIEEEAKIKNFFPQGRPINSKHPGLIVVHPFYFGFNGKKYQQHNQLKDKSSYLTNLRCLLSQSDRNLVLFESYSRCKSTLDLLSSWRSLDGVYLIETGSMSPEPINAGFSFEEWENMAERILKVSGKFEFAGGQLYGDISDSSSLDGCLGGAFRELHLCDVKGKFKHGACFHSTDYGKPGWE